MTEPKSVLQPWVHYLTMMQQTVLLTAIRGPDGIGKYHATKYLLRWFRRCVLYSAMDQRVLQTPFEGGGGSFTGVSFDTLVHGDVRQWAHDWEAWLDKLVGQYLQATDELPHHFQMHLLHAAEIIGYKHPIARTRCWWQRFYFRLVSDLHLTPETEAALDRRLGDSETQWLETADEATRT